MTIYEDAREAHGFRWVRGMHAIHQDDLDHNSFVVVDAQVRQIVVWDHLENKTKTILGDELLEYNPDVNDPATIGCMQALALKRHHGQVFDFYTDIAPRMDGTTYLWSIRTSRRRFCANGSVKVKTANHVAEIIIDALNALAN